MSHALTLMRPHRPHKICSNAGAACAMPCMRRYALPRSLKEYKLVCTGADKPLYALALLQQLSAEPTVVFTASVEATRRYVPSIPKQIFGHDQASTLTST